jgi:hypothetical protein
MFEKIIENKFKISIVVIISISLVIGIAYVQSLNKPKADDTQPETNLQSGTTQGNLETFSPGEVSINPDYDSELGLSLPSPSFKIAETLQNTPKVDKLTILDYIPVSKTDSEQQALELNVSIIEDLTPGNDGDAERLLPDPILPKLDNDELSKIYIINDENKNLVNLGYGIDFYKVFSIDNKPFHIILKSDISSSAYVYVGYDLTKLTLLDSNVTEYFGLKLVSIDDVLFFSTYPNQNSEEADTLKFSISVPDLAKKDLSKKIEIPQQPAVSPEGS